MDEMFIGICSINPATRAQRGRVPREFPILQRGHQEDECRVNSTNALHLLPLK